MRFFLGTHETSWVRTGGEPLFISHRRLSRHRRLPTSRRSWALDSGGFSELSMYGEWRTTPIEYVKAVGRYADEIGMMAWAAIQDWMCEPFMLAKTRKTIVEHQRLTVENYDTLLDLAPELPWRPVLQGWVAGDYLRHLDAYRKAKLPVDDRTVGIGSICRRHNSLEAVSIARTLAQEGLRLHGFGVKTEGLVMLSGYLDSADSMAWSFRARRAGAQADCPHRHKSCANCRWFAERWRDRLLRSLTGPRQEVLPL